MKIFSRIGELEEPITLEEAMEYVTLHAALTCLRSRNGKLDRAQLSAVLRYYFMLQKLELPCTWPISEIFIAELRSACRVAKVNKEGRIVASKNPDAIKAATGAPLHSMPSTPLYDPTIPNKKVIGFKPP